MHPIRVSIPSFRSENNSIEKGYTVFKIEVLLSGRQHTVEKRYSEFHALHKMLKKSIKPPEIPSKHVRNWIPKVLEQRRHGLELYLQTIIMENGVLPKIFLDFLNIRHFPSVPKTESCGSFDTESEESSKLSHQPVLLFLRDPYLLPSAHDTFSNVVIEGVIHGVFYPDLQPRYSCRARAEGTSLRIDAPYSNTLSDTEDACKDGAGLCSCIMACEHEAATPFAAPVAFEFALSCQTEPSVGEEHGTI